MVHKFHQNTHSVMWNNFLLKLTFLEVKRMQSYLTRISKCWLVILIRIIWKFIQLRTMLIWIMHGVSVQRKIFMIRLLIFSSNKDKLLQNQAVITLILKIEVIRVVNNCSISNIDQGRGQYYFSLYSCILTIYILTIFDLLKSCYYLSFKVINLLYSESIC